MAVCLLTCSGAVAFAYRQSRAVLSEYEDLCEGIEIASVGQAREGSEVDEILLDVFQVERHELSVLGLNELIGRAALVRTQTATLARGLARIPFLAGGAGALTVFAFGGLTRQAMILGGACVAAGLVTSFCAQAYAKHARTVTKRYSDVVESLSRRVETSWTAQVREPEVVS